MNSSLLDLAVLADDITAGGAVEMPPTNGTSTDRHNDRLGNDHLPRAHASSWNKSKTRNDASEHTVPPVQSVPSAINFSGPVNHACSAVGNWADNGANQHNGSITVNNGCVTNVFVRTFTGFYIGAGHRACGKLVVLTLGV